MHYERVTIERGPDQGDRTEQMAREVHEGLSAEQPWLPCKYFYDDRGSELFEAITRLPEYYQTRTETQLLESVANELIGAQQPSELVELGSGVGRKIRLLLDSMERQDLLRRCTFFDINENVLVESAHTLATAYPGLLVRGIVGDFLNDLALIESAEERLLVFLAGTIGNIEPEKVPAFLETACSTLGEGSGALIGFDLVKDSDRLEAAYNDSAGVTAQFNLNILEVMNRRLDADFEIDGFEHVAFYNHDLERIEMRLQAQRPMQVTIPNASVELELADGDDILTEISCKYTRSSCEQLLEGSGLQLQHWFTDPDDLFALALLQPE
jgi:L-histidine N-alpha-methyltransferase